jgi:hypothetical protein
MHSMFARSFVALGLLASAGFAHAGCNNLTVNVSAPGWTVDGNIQITCNHGNVVSQTSNAVVLSNSGYYGPDCRIGFTNGSSPSVIEFQQNYCFLSAGNISVSPLAGPAPQYTKQEGSYSSGTGGVVNVTGFAAANDAKSAATKQFK